VAQQASTRSPACPARPCLADRIVDIVSTGKTLKENGLVEYEEIVDITSRLIANPVSYRLKQERIRELVGKLREQVRT
jgi:ATP phosphoribosyltransferase